MGGIEFATEALRDCWKEDGHSVTLLSTDIPRGAKPSTPEAPRLPAWNFTEDLLQVNTPFIPHWHRHRIRDLVASHDVINTHSLAPSLSVLAMREAIRQNKPLVVTQHVGVIPHKIGILGTMQKHFICREAQRAVNAGAYLTFVGQAVRDWFQETAGLDASRLKMTPAGINQQVYNFVPDEERANLRQKWKLKEEQLNVLFVGRFYDKKGLPLIQEVAATHPDIQFNMVGGGPLDPTSWNLPNVNVYDFVSNEELRELYGAHDLFIMPSFGEGWPAVVPQAMICGTPCMISEECFTGYQKDQERFIVVKRDAESITSALEAFDRSSTDRKAISGYAQKTWDWMATARIYLNLFRELNPEV